MLLENLSQLIRWRHDQTRNGFGRHTRTVWAHPRLQSTWSYGFRGTAQPSYRSLIGELQAYNMPYLKEFNFNNEIPNELIDQKLNDDEE